MFRRLYVSILTSLIVLLSVGLASSQNTHTHGYAVDDQASIGTFWVANRFTPLLPNPYDKGTPPKRHIPRGSKMKAISAFKDTATGSYIQVNHQGVIGWVEASDIVIDSGKWLPPAESAANGVRYSITNVKNWASLRSTATAQSSRLFRVPRGAIVTTTGRKAFNEGWTWLSVKYEGQHGWIPTNFLRKGGGVAGNKPPKSGGAYPVGQYRIVNVKNWASLRSTATARSTRYARVPRGAIVTTTGQKAFNEGWTWLEVKYNGQNGWIPTKFLRKGGGVAGNKPRKSGGAYPVGQYRIVNVKNWASLRSRANRSAKRIRTIPRDQVVFHRGERRQVNGETWLRIEFGGSAGWMPDQYLRVN